MGVVTRRSKQSQKVSPSLTWTRRRPSSPRPVTHLSAAYLVRGVRGAGRSCLTQAAIRQIR
ncbi:hypothetical protein E2C01_081074 [Portunus trituberculatus]|uniref:Uncharacterized protein n=1 Tax=Portunus trituberculatus TaxID=210409 RepID=A0A5B7ILA0_PORTR|nr:hypothetical protein [Portunus trituberculatus]